MHAILLVDGLPEGIKEFEANADRFTYGKGACRLREIKIYDLQFPEEMKERVIKNFYRPANQNKYRDSLSLRFEEHQAHFQHGKLRKLINLAVGTIGRFFGLQPFRESKEELPPGTPLISTKLMNVYALALVNDAHVLDKHHNFRREWL